MRISPFVLGHVAGVLIVIAGVAALIEFAAATAFAEGLAAGAAVSLLICWWWPGFPGPGWKLWLVGGVANPLFIAATVWSISEYKCLLGWDSGWNCMLTEFGPMVAGLCLLPPLVGGRPAKALRVFYVIYALTYIA